MIALIVETASSALAPAHLLMGLVLAVATTYSATPVAIWIAGRLQFYDRPQGYKGHARPTPYLGGAAVVAGFVLALVLVGSGNSRHTLVLVTGALILWGVGTIDDRRTLSPLFRVASEVCLGAAVWGAGLGWHLHISQVIDLAATCLWIVAVVNAFNLFDNMDGAASTMALVASVAIALLGILNHRTWLPAGAVALAGACLGFLPSNMSRPARIFLGDGGSMPLGFAVAVLAMHASVVSVQPWQAPILALLLVGLPTLDTCLVIVSRRRRGISLLTGGRDHLTHRARSFLPSAPSVAFALGAIQALVSLIAVIASRGGSVWIELAAVLYMLAGAGAIFLLEARPVEEIGAPTSATYAPRTRVELPAAAFGLVVLGLGAGISPFFFAYYGSSVWLPIGLGLTAAAGMGVIARPGRLTAPASMAVAGLLGLGVWSLSSSAWAESVENAVVSGNRLLVYGALLVLAVLLIRSERRSMVLLAAVGAGLAAVAIYVLAVLLSSDSISLFLGRRLNDPLGYINGEGCLFVMGLWLCAAAAEQRRAAIAGAGAAGATLMACLALLTESRGTALAMAVSAAVVVALVPGRRRRLLVLAFVGAGFAAAAPALLHVYTRGAGTSVSVSLAHPAGRATLMAAVAVGCAWALTAAVYERASSSDAGLGRAMRIGGSAVLAALAAAALVLALASSSTVDRIARTQWHAFTHLSEPREGITVSQTRLLSGAGNRYDYWRIAWRLWQQHPVIGVGAGNYAQPYFAMRATSEDVQQPHSLELQTLSELGLVGAGLLLLFLAGVLAGTLRMSRAVARSRTSRALHAAALGVFVAWLTQTSADWMHLLPGLTAIALLAVAVLIRPDHTTPTANIAAAHAPRRTPVGGVVVLATILVALTMAGASLTRQGLADHFRTDAQNALAHDPATALHDANRSLSLDGDAVSTYYLKAAALARFDRAAAARQTLEEALQHEPRNFVTWALLGDLNVRGGRLREAASDYRRAHTLNPREPGLALLARRPKAALD